MTQKSTPSVKSLLTFAQDLADQSAKAILPHFRKVITVDNKAGGNPVDGKVAAGTLTFDPVTAADRAAERVIAKAISRAFPDHGLVGEEYGTRSAAARFRWVVDPIDGTRAFIMGYPLWGTLIGLLDGESPILGLMDQPYTRERLWCGQGASYLRIADGKVRRIKTRACAKLSDATFSTTDPDLFAPGREAAGFQQMKSRARMTRYGGDCYAYAMLAAGFVDVVVEAGLKSHDIVALIPIIEGAGGRITTWDGGPATEGGRIVAAGDPRLHAEALRVLAG